MVALLAITASTNLIPVVDRTVRGHGVRQRRRDRFTGLVIGLWCLYSALGGFVYGGDLSRTLSPLKLIAVLGLLTIPLGLPAGRSGGGSPLALIPAEASARRRCRPLWMFVRNGYRRGSRRGNGLDGTALTIATGAPVSGAFIDTFGRATTVSGP
ncbi:MAG TPA: hypothetical protein VF062_06585 [Candidatus Limnocylindrales bacterium]